MKLPKAVTIREVGPRDGLQAEKRILSVDQKVALINALSRTGLRRIEAVSFVHPRAIPQLADSEAVMAAIDRRPDVVYSALVPNAKGAERAVASGVDELLVVFSASETHNRRNVHASVQESLASFKDVLAAARPAGVPVAAAIATAFGCPFEGQISDERLLSLIGRLSDLGIDDVTLGDTAGLANPRQVGRVCTVVGERFPDTVIGLHFHNTRGAATANTLAGLLAGVCRFDGAIGGLGGCPFVPNATGNVATEDIVYMLEQMGIATGIDLAGLIGCARLAQELLGRELPGHVMKAEMQSGAQRCDP